MSEATLSTKPYTMEEINARIAQSERDSAEGRVYDFDDAICELEEELAHDEEHIMFTTL